MNRCRFLYAMCLSLWISSDLLHGQQLLLESIHSKAYSEEITQADLLVQGNNQFAFELYQQLNKQRGNTFFSPYSIFSAFGMAALGAKGETLQEMQRVLHYSTALAPLARQLNQQLLTSDSASSDSSQLLLANALWIQTGLPLQPTFQQAVQSAYQTPIEFADFSKKPVETAKKINGWVSHQTRGRISQLFSSQDITRNTRLVLTSAIYMKGSWMHPFDPKETKKGSFYALAHSPTQVWMMKKTAQYPLFVHEQFAMIMLPYAHSSDQGPELAMVIILPHKEIGVDTLEKNLNLANWQQWMSKLKMARVNLSLPRFRLEKTLNLNDVMKELGMVKAFNTLADFSGITGQRDLYISQAVHKTFVQVDEKGTEAAAATGIAMNLTAIFDPNPPYDFIVDHPFLFIIFDKKTGTVLFLGRLLQP